MRVGAVKLKLLYLITEDWFFCSHFMERAIAARESGYDVFVVAREGAHSAVIRAAGLSFIPLQFERRSFNLYRELRLLISLLRIYKQQNPDLVHHIAIKPILYGSLVARVCGLRNVINSPVGMGYVFSSSDLKARLLRPFLKLGYKLLINPPASRVIFENKDDLASFVQAGSVRRSDAILIRGAGIDLQRYQPVTKKNAVPVVVLSARMLRDKGVIEFVAAAQQLHREGVLGRFILIGDSDPGNPASITSETLRSWDGNWGVEWWGWRDDMVAILRNADIACLPSYREGLPKTLLEAAASGLPIVTTDTPGCREVVVDGENGFLVPVRNVELLVSALRKLLTDPDLRVRMGMRGRTMAVHSFSSEQVVSETLAVYEQVLATGVPECDRASGDGKR